MTTSKDKVGNKVLSRITGFVIKLADSVQGDARTNLAIDAAYTLIWILIVFMVVYLTRNLRFKHRDLIVYISIIVSLYLMPYGSFKDCRKFLKKLLLEKN